jgi:hypothetical protein
MWAALCRGAFGRGTDVNETAWRFAGEPIPQMREDEDDPDRYLSDPDLVARVEIPIERCSGRVLLVSALDDQMWRSSMLSDIAVRRAERLGVADRVEHVAHPDAGHACGAPPGYPISRGIRHPVDDVYSALGGTRAGNQLARRASWRRLIDTVGS